MGDVNLTEASVKPTATTIIARGTYGDTIVQGTILYYAATTDTWEIADCTTSAATANAGGMALSSGADGQPGRIATGGDVTVDNISLASPVYILSEAGQIAPSADLANDDYITVVGVASSTTNLKLSFKAAGVVAAGIV
jgi:hypothetical protein